MQAQEKEEEWRSDLKETSSWVALELVLMDAIGLRGALKDERVTIQRINVHDFIEVQVQEARVHVQVERRETRGGAVRRERVCLFGRTIHNGSHRFAAHVRNRD